MTITISLPGGFASIPLHEEGEERSRAIDRLLDLADNGTIDRNRAARGLVAVADSLRTNGAIVGGQIALVDSSPDVSATLVLAVRALPGGGPELDDTASRSEAARAIVSVVGKTDKHARAQYRELGCGPVALILRSGHFPIPANYSLTGSSVDAPTDSLQAMIPMPDGRTIAVLDVSTSARTEWPQFLQLGMKIIDGIRIQEPQE